MNYSKTVKMTRSTSDTCGRTTLTPTLCVSTFNPCAMTSSEGLALLSHESFSPPESMSILATFDSALLSHESFSPPVSSSILATFDSGSALNSSEDHFEEESRCSEPCASSTLEEESRCSAPCASSTFFLSVFLEQHLCFIGTQRRIDLRCCYFPLVLLLRDPHCGGVVRGTGPHHHKHIERMRVAYTQDEARVTHKKKH